MKTIGMIGGMSWESTQTYYRMLNENVRSQLGGLHSAKLVLYSVDFSEIETLQHRGEWSATADILCAAAKSVQAAGAECLLICTNTMHKVAPQIEQAVDIPLIHIADATAKVLVQDGLSTVGLLGTRFTMEESFYRDRIEQAGIKVLVPEKAQREHVHSVIYEELCRGEIKPDSKQAYLEVIGSLAERGAEGVILGCTEIGLLIAQSDTSLNVYDTTEIHARIAIEYALSLKR